MELVSVPYEVKPDLYRSTAPLRSGAPSAELQALKQSEFLGPRRHDLLGTLPTAKDGIPRLANALGLPASDLETLALHSAEDLALLHNGVLQGIAFAFPSGFRPTEKLGQDFAAVHAPVADGEALRAASAGITAAMKRPGAHFERGVWTLTSRPGLSQHPDLPRPQPETLSDLWFRTEFQVLQSLGEGWAGFSVRVEMTPWTAVEPALQSRIADSIRSMSSATRTYKNLHEIAVLLGV